jgi:hypothetical protein
MLIVLCMRCANYAQGLRVGKFSVSVLWVALGHIGKFQWWSSESVSYSACCCGASEVRPASFSVLDPCKPSASSVPILPSAAKQSKFHHHPPPPVVTRVKRLPMGPALLLAVHAAAHPPAVIACHLLTAACSSSLAGH